MAFKIIWPSGRGGGKKKQMERLERELVLTKEEHELLKMYMKNPEKVDSVVNACALTAEDIKEGCRRMTVLARGHHIRNADGTTTDVSNDPNYQCNDYKY